ncbi:MAG: PQQ-dependent sugar dehydrogenase [Acidimicrobiia bacterium]|nr:PQQ-dependent sugar dehydrogenase [Acidimicrobiia bacterium]MBP8179679.1 PQQ-dependent sugar dehydrogenase [Acidimicrobiia bacterium]
MLWGRSWLWCVAFAFAASVAAACGSDDPEVDGSRSQSSVGVGQRTPDQPPSDYELQTEAPTFSVTPMTVNAKDPVDLARHPDSGDIFIAEKSGTVRRLDEDGDLSEPVIEEPVATNMLEQGLLGMVFSPDGSYLYTNRVTPEEVTAIEAYRWVNGAPQGDAVTILEVPQPYENHNGGGMAFDDNGLLYIGFGDGGSAGDPENNGQNANTLLGSLVRIRPVPEEGGYEIPAENPFALGGGAPEVLHLGLRNPWRFFIDEERGLLWIADVGQRVEEEIDVVSLDEAGLNFGWAVKEGLTDYETPHTPWGDGVFADPAYVYDHEGGRCSITGGVVVADNTGEDWYLFGDFCSSEIWAMNADDILPGESAVFALPQRRVRNPVAFALDDEGNAYVLDQTGFVGKISLTR